MLQPNTIELLMYLPILGKANIYLYLRVVTMGFLLNHLPEKKKRKKYVLICCNIHENYE